jgi:hypothetical protein
LNIAHKRAILYVETYQLIVFGKVWGIMYFESEYEKLMYKKSVEKEVYESEQFRRVVLGVLLVAMDGSIYRNSKKIELLYFAQEALDSMTVAELEEIYNEYARNDFKKKR